MSTMFADMDKQAGIDFPQSLSDKYRPKRMVDFVGMHKPRKVMQAFCAKPYSSAWFFLGASGLGKTSMALALVEELRGELHHIPSRNCDLATIDSVTRMCHYVPKNGLKSFHVVVVDEADQMSRPAQLALLSKLDATAFPPQTIFIFTANGTSLLEPRFLSRCKILEFERESLNTDLHAYLARIYAQEGGTFFVDLDKLAHDADFNVRDALGKLEVELLMGSDREDVPAPKPKPVEPKPEVKAKVPAKSAKPVASGKGKLYPFIKHGFEITAEFKGQGHKATVNRDGTITYAGEVYASPSGAAKAVTGRSCDGWVFWKYSKGGTLVPLYELQGA